MPNPKTISMGVDVLRSPYDICNEVQNAFLRGYNAFSGVSTKSLKRTITENLMREIDANYMHAETHVPERHAGIHILDSESTRFEFFGKLSDQEQQIYCNLVGGPLLVRKAKACPTCGRS